MWKVTTGAGTYAVKELNLTRDWPCDFDAVFTLEDRAWRAGLPLPRPIPNPSGCPVARFDDVDTSVLVHEWVDGVAVPYRPVEDSFAAAVGDALARLHRLDVGWPASRAVPTRPPRRETWGELARTAAELCFPWADRLAATVPTFQRVERLVDEWEPLGGDVVVTHRDLGQKNLLDSGGAPLILDWEASGPAPSAHELGATALSLASDSLLIELKPVVLQAVVVGYRAAGGRVPVPGPHWFSMLLSNWRHFLRWNVLRCIDHRRDLHQAHGPSVEVAHAVVERGLTAIPAIMASLDRLTEILDDACS